MLGLVEWHRQIGKSNPAEFWASVSGIVTIVAFIGMAAILVVALWWCLADRQAGARRWVLALDRRSGIAHAGVHTHTGEKLGSLLLYPREWKKAKAANLSILDKADQSEPYVVADEDLGWTLSKGRRSQNGLYSIVSEGFRTARAAEVIANETQPCRIALVGDSFTFDEEVTFEDSCGYQLERLLPLGCQVLNFGVLRYGVDQMYLRYARDVRPWRPNIVVFSVIDFDFLRTVAVYAFLLFPNSDMPWAKPRFVLKDGQLVLLNVPTPSPEVIFSASSIRDLPFITYDRFYFSAEWDREYWKLFNFSYLFRFIIS